MIISLFRNNRPSVYLWLLVYTFFLRGLFLLHPVFEKPPEGAFLSPYIIDWIKQANISVFALQLGDILFVYFEAIIFNFILTANSIFHRSSFIPAMIFITLSSLFGEWIIGSAQTIAQLFLLLSMMNLFRITGKELSRENIFYTSLFLSIGSLFYFPVSLFLLVIIVGMVLNGFSFSDLVLILIGFILPYFFIGLGIYYVGNVDNYFYFIQMHFFVKPKLGLDVNIPQAIMLCYIFILVVYGYLALQTDREFKIVKHRRLVLTVLGYFILSALAGPFISGDRLLYLQMIVLPGSIFVTKIFNTPKLRYYHHILFLIIFLGSIAFQLEYLQIVRF